MSDTFSQYLEKYANLAIHSGVNLQKGQVLVITASIESLPFVRILTQKAYEAGAIHVHVEWSDDELTKIRYKHAPDEAFSYYPEWKAKGLEEMAANGAAFLQVSSPNPELLKGMDPERIATANKTGAKALYTYRSYLMADRACWSVIGAASVAWARMVFPDQSEEQAVDSLWDMIFRVNRVYDEDPIQAWVEHGKTLREKIAYLNEKQYKQLIYTAPGTSLTIDLPTQHLWNGGFAVSEQGTRFNPNMPTEEVFTMPHKEGVNGTVRSTKPLNYAGNIIDGFSLTFKEGEVVDFTADKGYDTLKNLLSMDEGARRLGEVALVPHQSPISSSGLIFYNTLFDENASSHLALGNAYPFTLAGGTALSKEELTERGANSSLAHVDFMIGSGEMDVDGVTEDGTKEAVFRRGNWAI